jgi:hypothetical protein
MVKGFWILSLGGRREKAEMLKLLKIIRRSLSQEKEDEILFIQMLQAVSQDASVGSQYLRRMWKKVPIL